VQGHPTAKNRVFRGATPEYQILCVHTPRPQNRVFRGASPEYHTQGRNGILDFSRKNALSGNALAIAAASAVSPGGEIINPMVAPYRPLTTDYLHLALFGANFHHGDTEAPARPSAATKNACQKNKMLQLCSTEKEVVIASVISVPMLSP
jgi:hypothetical protein